VIDWFGLIDVPGVNDLSISTHTELGYVMQASGPFARRSAMAAYFALLIPVGVLAALYVDELSKRRRILLLLSAFTCALALTLTHNRAGLLGGLAAIGVVTLYLARSPAKVVRVVLLGTLAMTVLIWLMATYLPEQY